MVALWLVFCLLLHDYAGWYGTTLYVVGTMFYAGFCLILAKDEEEEDGDTVSRKEDK
jgi:hypothetical protein